ncbi:MAG: 3-deoxy-manno-octulosonate cytidylyltransferase [Verrucomicrobiia bacterium]
MRILGVIPARFASSRFPGKSLHLIAGKPLVQHVVEQCRKASALVDVIVATDDERIAEAMKPHCRVEMTASDHPSGSDRIAEVAARNDCDAVVNVQGDEPMIDPEVINSVALGLTGAAMSTAATAITDAEEFDNPNVVKVVTDSLGRALYFSRRTVPYLRDHAGETAADQLNRFPFLKHIGIYGYRRETLLELVKHRPSPLEMAEKLEQLRALENGIPIAVVKVNYQSIGVDTPEDAQKVEALLNAQAQQQ